MSRVGERPIQLPSGVTVNVEGQSVSVRGPLGELSIQLPPAVTAGVDGTILTVQRADDSRESRSLHGTMRSLLTNMIEGVSKGFSKELEVEGVGFKASVQGQTLALSLGFSSSINYAVPEGVKIEVERGTRMKVSGADKQLVGDTAARIRSFCPVEPYKGKGVRYGDEVVHRKVGKTVA